jgi:hypothetical protein
MLCLCMTFSYLSFSQCGAAPTSGSTIISTTNTIANSYYPGTGNATKNTYTVPVGALDARGSATAVSSGDMVLIIQMQGADINSSNSNSYGDGVNTGNASGYLTSNLVAGFYEYNVVSSFNSGVITLSYPLYHNYYAKAFTSSTGIQTYQVIRVQRHYDLTINAGNSITAPAWNGSTGGVVVLEVANKLTLNGSVNVDGLGFRGGGGKRFTGTTSGNNSNNGAPVTAITKDDFRWNSPITNASNTTGGAKGEGIAGTPAYVLPLGAINAVTMSVEGYVGGSMGYSAPGNAGGGGTDGKSNTNDMNTGGGGGGNGGAGGKGGSGWDGGTGNPATYNTGGYGGAAFAQASKERFIMGGGGGAGTGNNSTAGTTDYLSSGACGGGIILIRAKLFGGNGKVSANGADAMDQNVNTVTDAAGGGGAGGSIIVVTNTTTAPGAHSITASANGGTGGDMSASYVHGPGGGGGGGYVLTNVLPNASITITGGAHGLTRTTNGGPLNNTYNSVSGSNGVKSVITGTLRLINIAALNSPCGSLPVTLTKWSGVYKNNKTYLSWQGENSINFSHFVVERSSDGAHFSPLGQVATVSSTAFSEHYSFEDALPVDGLNYYRLKMVDIDGQYSYSGVLIIRTNGSGIQITATPNPFTEHVVITIQSTTNETANLRVFNSAGKLVWRKTTYVNAGTNVQYYNDLQSLTPGVYIIKVNKGNTTGEFKLIKR